MFFIYTSFTCGLTKRKEKMLLSLASFENRIRSPGGQNMIFFIFSSCSSLCFVCIDDEVLKGRKAKEKKRKIIVEPNPRQDKREEKSTESRSRGELQECKIFLYCMPLSRASLQLQSEKFVFVYLLKTFKFSTLRAGSRKWNWSKLTTCFIAKNTYKSSQMRTTHFFDDHNTLKIIIKLSESRSRHTTSFSQSTISTERGSPHCFISAFGIIIRVAQK